MIRMSVALLHVAEFKVSPPFLRGIASVKHHCAVDPDLLSFAIDTEGITRPKHYVGVLPNFNRADFVVETKRPRRVDRQPLDGLVFTDVDARGASGIHRF